MLFSRLPLQDGAILSWLSAFIVEGLALMLPSGEARELRDGTSVGEGAREESDSNMKRRGGCRKLRPRLATFRLLPLKFTPMIPSGHGEGSTGESGDALVSICCDDTDALLSPSPACSATI